MFSFGILLTELVTGGRTPYEGMSNAQVVEAVAGACQYRIPLSDLPGCPPALYHIMTLCWHASPTQRPSFHSLHECLCHFFDAAPHTPHCPMGARDSPEMLGMCPIPTAPLGIGVAPMGIGLTAAPMGIGLASAPMGIGLAAPGVGMGITTGLGAIVPGLASGPMGVHSGTSLGSSALNGLQGHVPLEGAWEEVLPADEQGHTGSEAGDLAAQFGYFDCTFPPTVLSV